MTGPAGRPCGARLAREFADRTQAELVELFEGSDACVAPVLSPGDAPAHPHNAARGTFIKVGGVIQPAAAPRFDRTPCATPTPPTKPGADTEAVRTAAGFSASEITALRDRGIAN